MDGRRGVARCGGRGHELIEVVVTQFVRAALLIDARIDTTSAASCFIAPYARTADVSFIDTKAPNNNSARQWSHTNVGD